jgi:peptide/nickel transport system substrate-binding protein
MHDSNCTLRPCGWLRYRRLISGASAAIIAATLLVAGGVTASATSAAKSSKPSITISVSDAPLSLDPAESVNDADQQVFNDLAYEPLIILNSNGDLVPGLATSWRYANSSDKIFDLTLRPGVRFSNGQPLTAQAVVQSINWMKKAEGPEVIYVNNVASAEAIGPLTVRLHLVQANPVIALLLTQRFVFGGIIAPSGSANPKALGTATEGAGPYKLDAAATIPGSSYVYVPNPYYYNKSAIHFSTFTVDIIANPQTALSAVESGEVAYADGAYPTAAAAQQHGVAVYSTLCGYYGVFLVDRGGALVPALKSRLVREALNYAVDRPAIVKAVFGSYGEPNDEVSIPGYEDEGYVPSLANYYTYDIAKAKQLLAQAGYPHGFTMSVTAVASLGDGVEMAEAVASDWAKIGVTVDIKTYANLSAAIGPFENKQIPAFMDNYDAQPMFIEASQLLAPNAGLFNIFGSIDPELTSLIATAYASTTNGAAAVAAAWGAVERRVVELGWEVPIATGADVYFASSALKGIAVSPTSFTPNPEDWYY